MKGELKVTVVSAKGLANKDAHGKSDPYVKLWIGNDPANSQRTKTQVGTLEPVWNETFIFKLKDGDNLLVIKVFDSDGPDPKHDDKLGEAKVDLSDIFKSSTVVSKTVKLPTWLGLFSEGEVNLKLEFKKL